MRSMPRNWSWLGRGLLLALFHLGLAISPAVIASAQEALRTGPALAEVNPDAMEFQVATVRDHPGADPLIQIGGAPGGRWQAKNASARMLVQAAYGVPAQLISGGPQWLDSRRFDVEAKIPEDAWLRMKDLDWWHADLLERPMVQALLKDRFRLEIQHAPAELKVFALVPARGGAHVRVAGIPRESRTDVCRQGCAMAMTANNSPIAAMTDFLSALLARPVVDQTGLMANYDIVLEVPLPQDNAPVDRDTLLLQALDDQLGLKLESRKAVVDTIVVVRMEMPGEN